MTTSAPDEKGFSPLFGDKRTGGPVRSDAPVSGDSAESARLFSVELTDADSQRVTVPAWAVHGISDELDPDWTDIHVLAPASSQQMLPVTGIEQGTGNAIPKVTFNVASSISVDPDALVELLIEREDHRPMTLTLSRPQYFAERS